MTVEQFLEAYVHESKHGECQAAYRFRAVMPSGMSEWFPTKAEALIAVQKAVAKAVNP